MPKIKFDMKVSDMIKLLQEIKKTNGDVRVFLSQDEEGNGFGAATNGVAEVTYEGKPGIILYPCTIDQEF